MTKSQITKAYSYLRFSRPEQMSGDSLRRQSQMAIDYAARHKLVLDEKLTFHDLGVSAYRSRNKDIGRLGDFLEAVRSGLVEKGSFLLVESLDRISRDKTRRALRTLEDMCEAGITVVTLADGREYTAESLDNDPSALIMSILIFMRANEESATKARRLKSAWENKRATAAAKPMTSRAPAWLKLSEDRDHFEIIEERAEVVRRIFNLALDGVGQHKIAEIFNREGIRVFGRGQLWHRTYIAKILKADNVIGTMTPHKIEYRDGRKTRTPQKPIEGYYPAIIDRGVYDRLRAMHYKTKAPLRGRHAKGEVQNIFGGLARCPLCGSTMTRVNKGGSRKAGDPKLVCTRAKVGSGCKYHSVPYQRVEEAFLQEARRILATVPAGKDDPEVDQEIEKIETLISVAEDSLENLLDAIQRGESLALTERIRAIENQLESLNKYHEELLELRAISTNALVHHKADDLESILDTGELDRGLVNALLRQLFTAVVVDYQSGDLIFEWHHGATSQVMYAWPEVE